MKTNLLSRIFGILAVFAACFLSGAALSFPITDAFNYPIGDLGGNTNIEGNPWTPMGTNTAGLADVVVTNFTLTYPGLLCPATNSVYFGGLSGYTERVAIAPAVISTNASNVVSTNVFALRNGTIYYSYVFVVTNIGAATTNGGFVTAFTTVTGASGTQPTIGGPRVYMRLNATNQPFGYEVGVGKQPATLSLVTWATNEFLAGGGAGNMSTNFVVASYTFVDSSTSNDVCQMWINPSSTTFGAAIPPAADVTNSSGSDIQVAGANQIESFYFRQGNSNIPFILASNLRIGTNWSDVTPPVNNNTNSAPSPVPLSVVRSGGNAIISWPTNFNSWRLQGTPSLISGSNAWTNVTAPTNIVGTNFSVTDPVSGTGNYYRLIYP